MEPDAVTELHAGKQAGTLARIISGGQTGVDRAALDLALELGLKIGGWCPKGRRSEAGPIPSKYPLIETETESYIPRTVNNILGSDGTLILYRGDLTPGTRLTMNTVREIGRPMFVAVLGLQGPEGFKAWLEGNGIKTLNVAGPRESKEIGVYQEAMGWLREALK